jgi:cysteine synthase
MLDDERTRSREAALARCRERGVVIPTFTELRDPSTTDPAIRAALPRVDMQAVDPLNLFRITWHNDVSSGGFGPVNALDIPPELSGVGAHIVGLLGAHFPTGAHKVGAAFGCLVPRLVGGEFDPTRHKAVWPSTGNYCRGGAFDSALLGCTAVAILPEQMSRERFAWLERMGAEIIATPGCESNVKEIFDACWEIRKRDPQAVIFNQFEEFGNYLWHWAVTGAAAAEVFRSLAGAGRRLAAWVGSSGSAGTLGAGDFLKQAFPGCAVTVAEALQCPTLLRVGFGAHRIEGIGDKHVPWIHNLRNTDVVAAIDDEATVRLLRLFNEPAGELLLGAVCPRTGGATPLLGFSSICTCWLRSRSRGISSSARTTSSSPASRLGRALPDAPRGLSAERGPYTERVAEIDFERWLLATTTDHFKELTFEGRKAIHNLKYFTWVEQQGRTVEELHRLWSPSFWTDLQAQLPAWDEAVATFNRDSGVAERLKAVRRP